MKERHFVLWYLTSICGIFSSKHKKTCCFLAFLEEVFMLQISGSSRTVFYKHVLPRDLTRENTIRYLTSQLQNLQYSFFSHQNKHKAKAKYWTKIPVCTTEREKAPEDTAYQPAKARASSVGTALRWRRSLLLPTSMMTMLLSAWSLSSFSQRSTFS